MYLVTRKCRVPHMIYFAESAEARLPYYTSRVGLFSLFFSDFRQLIQVVFAALWLCMYVCVWVCMYVCTYVRMYECIPWTNCFLIANEPTYIHTYIHTCMNMLKLCLDFEWFHIHMYIYTCIHNRGSYAHAYMQVLTLCLGWKVSTHAHTHIHTYQRIMPGIMRMYVYMYVCMYACMCPG